MISGFVILLVRPLAGLALRLAAQEPAAATDAVNRAACRLASVGLPVDAKVDFEREVGRELNDRTWKDLCRGKPADVVLTLAILRALRVALVEAPGLRSDYIKISAQGAFVSVSPRAKSVQRARAVLGEFDAAVRRHAAAVPAVLTIAGVAIGLFAIPALSRIATIVFIACLIATTMAVNSCAVASRRSRRVQRSADPPRFSDRD